MAKKKEQLPEGFEVLSNDPDEAVDSGLFNDEDATVVSARVVNWERVGFPDSTALKLILTPDYDSDLEIEQFWSIGDPELYKPWNDGKTIVSKKKLNKDSNYVILTKQLKKVGFPPEKLAGTDVTVFEGLHAHWMRMPPEKERPWMKDRKRKDGSVQEDLVLVTTKIYDSQAKGKTKTKAKTKDAPANAENTGAEEACIQAVIMALITAGGEMPKNDAIRNMGEYLPEDWDVKTKNKAIQARFKDDWFGAQTEHWTLESGVLKQV